MTRPAPVESIVDALYSRIGDFSSLPGLLGLVAADLDANAIHLGLDLGHGYHHDSFGGVDESTPSGLIRLAKSSLPEGWIEQRTLPVGTPGRRGKPRSGIAVLRRPDQPAFAPAERKRLTQLLPHLNRVLTLTHELEVRRQREQDAYAALEHADQGMLLVALDGQVLHSNTRARELLEQTGTRIAGGLYLPDRELQARYDQALTRVSLHSTPDTLDLLLPAAPPVLLRLHPTLQRPGYLPSTLIVTLTSRTEARPPLPTVVKSHFGLTPGEFRLCQALLDGLTLKQCAQDWDRSYDTLRGHLKSLLAKTGTHRQAELISLLHSFTAR